MAATRPEIKSPDVNAGRDGARSALHRRPRARSQWRHQNSFDGFGSALNPSWPGSTLQHVLSEAGTGRQDITLEGQQASQQGFTTKDAKATGAPEAGKYWRFARCWDKRSREAPQNLSSCAPVAFASSVLPPCWP